MQKGKSETFAFAFVFRLPLRLFYAEAGKVMFGLSLFEKSALWQFFQNIEGVLLVFSVFDFQT